MGDSSKTKSLFSMDVSRPVGVHSVSHKMMSVVSVGDEAGCVGTSHLFIKKKCKRKKKFYIMRNIQLTLKQHSKV